MFVLFSPHPHPSFVEGANLALLDLDYINTFDNLTSPSTSASNAAANTWNSISASKWTYVLPIEMNVVFVMMIRRG